MSQAASVASRDAEDSEEISAAEPPDGAHTARIPTGCSAAIQEVNRLIRKVAAHDSNVLICGESGTGKEVVARAIHDSSPRRARPFVAINCGAIPAELLESELFGHERGAFTGAIATRKGRFEIADGGTLFLDEIGDMSFPMQVKLLRVLQERIFERVGAQVPIRANVRIIAATHRNLEEAIASGTFREDLYYRLAVFPIEMPALRERMGDLPALIEQFAEANAAAGRARVTLAPGALAALAAYRFPGNVRELSNLVERLSILAPGRPIEIEDLPPRYRPAGWTPESASATAPRSHEPLSPLPEIGGRAWPIEPPAATGTPSASELPDRGVLGEERVLALLDSEEGSESLAALPVAGCDLKEHLASIERRLIEQALERAQGTVAHAARLLGLRRTTLVEKLRKFGMAAGEVATEV